MSTLHNSQMGELLADAERLRKDSRAASPANRVLIENKREALRVRLQRMRECEPRPAADKGRTDWVSTGLAGGLVAALAVVIAALVRFH